MARGDQRARTIAAGFHDHRRDRKPADDAVAVVVMRALGFGAGRVFADNRAGEQDVAHQTAVLRRIAHIHAARQHGNRQPARAQGAAMGSAVVAERHAADRDKPRAPQRRADAFRGVQSIGRSLPRADHGNAGRHVKVRPAPAHIQHGRRVLDGAQPVGIGAVAQRDDLDARFGTVGDDALRFPGVLVAQRIHLRLAQPAGRGNKRLPVRGIHRIGRAECTQQLRRGTRPEPAPQGKPNITQT